jgi:hypothetical protein
MAYDESKLDANHQKLWNEFETWKLKFELEHAENMPKSLDGQLACFLMQRVSNLEVAIKQLAEGLQGMSQLFSNMQTHRQGAKLLLPND